MSKVLVVDGDDRVLRFFKQALGRIENCVVVTSNSAKKALKRARAQEFDVVISEFRMQDMDGISFLKQIRELQPLSMRIMLAALCDRQALCAVVNEAADHRQVIDSNQLDVICNIVEDTLALRQQLATA